MKKMATKTGKAYGFFDCNATKEEIEREIPFIRNAVGTPNELELSLMEGRDTLPVDIGLLKIASDTKYVMEATCPNATNEQTADELSAVINQAYQSQLYQEEEKFRGEVAYKENEEYVFLE